MRDVTAVYLETDESYSLASVSRNHTKNPLTERVVVCRSSAHASVEITSQHPSKLRVDINPSFIERPPTSFRVQIRSQDLLLKKSSSENPLRTHRDTSFVAFCCIHRAKRNNAMSSTMLKASALSSRRLMVGPTIPGYIRPFSSSPTASGTKYESPFQEFFDMIEQGRTSLGTTENTPKPQDKILKCGVKESAMRFKTMHYGRAQLAPHIEPGEHRVTLKVSMNEIPLTEAERDIVRQVVGDRVNEERNELRLTSNQFGSRIENKRHLVSMLDRIVLTAKRLATELDDNDDDDSQKDTKEAEAR